MSKLCRSILLFLSVGSMTMMLSCTHFLLEEAEIVSIVKKGTPSATIILGQNPTISAQFAAKELQVNIKKITGAVLPIVNKSVDKGLKIYVGESEAIKVFGFSNDSFKDQEYLVRITPDAIILTGKDEADYRKLDYNNDKTFPSVYGNRGSSLAVYDFLEKFCNIRWYGPTDLEMVYTPRKTVEVKLAEIRRTPGFKYYLCHPNDRHALLKLGYPKSYGLWNKPSEREFRLFIRRMRWGGIKYGSSHSFNGYHQRFGWKNPKNPKVFEKAHPEYFGKGFQMNCSVWPKFMCYSNPGLLKQTVQDARDFFDGKGRKYKIREMQANGKFFAVNPNDRHGACKCEQCQAQIGKNPHKSVGVYPASNKSNYIWGFRNKVAKELQKSHPGTYVSALAYHDYAAYPTNVKLEPNIAVQLCLLMHYWNMPWVKENDLEIYNSWLSKERNQKNSKRPIYLWIYNCFPDETALLRGFHCFPNFQPHTIAKQVKMYHKDGINGFFLNGISQQLDHYVYAKMSDDPTLDVDKLMNEFFTRYYGSAAIPMKQLYDMIEDIGCSPSSYPKAIRDKARKDHFYNQTEEIAWKCLGTEKRLARMDKLVQQAKASATTDIERQRVTLFETSILDYMKQGRKEYLKKVAQQPAVDKRKKQAPPTVYVPFYDGLSAGGDPEKVNWAKAAGLSDWAGNSGRAGNRNISGLITYDDKYLYVRLREKLDGLTLISKEHIEKGGFMGVNFSDRQNGWTRYLAQINPEGIYASKFWGKNDSRIPITLRSKINNDEWIIDIAFPFDVISPGATNINKPLYANFYRKRPATMKPNIFIVWSPTFDRRKIFRMERAGKLIMLKKGETAESLKALSGRLKGKAEQSQKKALK
jgi:uncharacterized protein DUF4838